jgi:hypothetical protein
VCKAHEIVGTSSYGSPVHADATDEQIIAAVRDAWVALEPLFDIVDPNTQLANVEVAAIEADLRATFADVHGSNAINSCYLPLEVSTFHGLVARTVISNRIGSWDFELFGRNNYVVPCALDDEERAAIKEHGLWHPVGRFSDKHELWVPVERNRVEFGRIYDFNDGRPLMTGALVADYIWPSMLELLIRIRPGAPAR